MRVVSPAADFDAQFDFIIDSESEPADLDAAVARFMLAYIRDAMQVKHREAQSEGGGDD